jgi:colanic acid/amylovoran biosynthesis protein
MAKAVKKWKKNDTKVILLPQAMGPFTFKKTRNAFAQIAEKADLIFPRDNVSYKHVTDLVGKQKHIIQAPDFTNLVKGVVPASYEKQENSFCIIPNYRMIDRTPPKESQKYIPFLVSCVNYLLKKGINPFILILEGENDFWIGNEISKKSNQPLKIIREIDPLGIKGIIGACNGVISSRYHGLVSALSQGVPALAIGWSHKYETLFSEYGFPKGCLNVNASNSEIIERIDLISEKTQVAKLIQQLSEAAYFQLQKSEMMWVRVFECLGLR